jgi:scyllo-inositol 2-dehydrogenase (NADP+)
MIDQALRLFGMPDAIEADIFAQRAEALVDDYFDVTLHYAALRVCLRSSSLVAAPRPRFSIHGTAGSFIKFGLDPQEAQLKAGIHPGDPGYGMDVEHGTLVRADGSRGSVPTERGNYLAYYEGIAATMLDGAPVPVPARDARDGLVLIDLARRAASSGQRLSLPGASSTAAPVPQA